MVQSLGVELHDWRRRPAAFRWRRIKRQRLFVQWLGPCSVDRESRNVLGASHNRRQREGNECDIQFHHAHAIAIM